MYTYSKGYDLIKAKIISLKQEGEEVKFNQVMKDNIVKTSYSIGRITISQYLNSGRDSRCEIKVYEEEIRLPHFEEAELFFMISGLGDLRTKISDSALFYLKSR